jgi:hypothetical protein
VSRWEGDSTRTVQGLWEWGQGEGVRRGSPCVSECGGLPKKCLSKGRGVRCGGMRERGLVCTTSIFYGAARKGLRTFAMPCVLSRSLRHRPILSWYPALHVPVWLHESLGHVRG